MKEQTRPGKTDVSWEEIAARVYEEHRRSIRVKKRKTLVKNIRRIFESALEISNRKGFAAMTMRDLSAASKLSMGALYAYFSGKDELLAMLQETGVTFTRTVIEGAVSADDPPARQLESAVTAHVYLSEAMRPWFYFSYMEARHLAGEEKEKAKAAEIAVETMLADIIRRGRESGDFPVSDERMTAAFIKAMIQDWYVKRWKYAKRGIGVDRFAIAASRAALALCQAEVKGD